MNGRIQYKHMDSALLVTSWDSDPRIMEALWLCYETVCDYLHWNIRGMVIELSCGTVEMTKQTKFSDQAYQLGLAL